MTAIYCDEYPNVFHWKAVSEFTLEQAALLLAGIDPFDFEQGLESAKITNHPRWKLAYGYALAIETVIRRGILTPVVCNTYFYDEYNSNWIVQKIEPSDRSHNISCEHTVITRNSLNQWVSNENIILVLPTSARKIDPPIIKKDNSCNDQSIIKMLSPHIHHSEGLDLTQEIIDQFWVTYDEENKQTAPTKDEIITYLTSKGVSKNLAEAVDMVLRPFELRKVGRRKKGVTY